MSTAIPVEMYDQAIDSHEAARWLLEHLDTSRDRLVDHPDRHVSSLRFGPGCDLRPP